MAPMPNHLHQLLVGRWTRVLDEIVTDAHLGVVLPGVNVSDRTEQWESNYRVPDIAVFLHSTAAVNCDTHWRGGPDFAIEVTSPDDRTREKLAFYAQVGTRELLIIDRAPWRLEVHRLEAGHLQLHSTALPGDGRSIQSGVLGFTASLGIDEPRPRLRVEHPLSGRSWLI